MRRAIPLAAAAVCATALLAAGGESNASVTAQAESATAEASAAKKQTRLTLRDSEYGKVLFDGKGRVLYLFTADQRAKSNCYGECATAWPPFYARGKLVAGPGVKAKRVGRTKRTDGRSQVTYAGKPLYYYVHDGRNEILCHDVFEFGGDWLVVQASGKPAP
jgi:predicted lipoprotein with Yx(FWY)xxD motif